MSVAQLVRDADRMHGAIAKLIQVAADYTPTQGYFIEAMQELAEAHDAYEKRHTLAGGSGSTVFRGVTLFQEERSKP